MIWLTIPALTVALNLVIASTPLPQVDELLVLTRTAQTSALHSALDRLLEGPAQEIGTRESRLLDYARRLRDEAPGELGRAALQRLAAYRSQVFDLPDDPRSTVRPPRYPVAAAARGSLALWRQQATGKRLAPFAELLDRGLRHPRILGQTLRSADPQTGLSLLPRALALPPQDALLALRLATANPALASPAVLAVGQLAQTFAPARQRLLDWLADPQLGSSAVEALARLSDPDLPAAVLKRYRQTPALRARLLLFLTRSRAPGARLLLQALAMDPTTPADLRAKLQPWLTP